LRFHRSEIVVLLVSSDQPHKKRGRFPRMPLNENWWRLESHWNHEAPTNTRKVSLKLSRHPDDILVYQSGAAWSYRALFWPNWRCKVSPLLSQIMGHARFFFWLSKKNKPVTIRAVGRLPIYAPISDRRRLETHWNREALTNTRKVSLKLSRYPDDILAISKRYVPVLVKSLLTVHSLVNNPYRFSLVFQTIEPLSFTNPATAWCSCCFVHLCPMTFFQVSPLRMIDIITIIHNTHAHPCCIIFQAGL
jgi:hypothetical protein